MNNWTKPKLMATVYAARRQLARCHLTGCFHDAFGLQNGWCSPTKGRLVHRTRQLWHCTCAVRACTARYETSHTPTLSSWLTEYGWHTVSFRQSISSTPRPPLVTREKSLSRNPRLSTSVRVELRQIKGLDGLFHLGKICYNFQGVLAHVHDLRKLYYTVQRVLSHFPNLGSNDHTLQGVQAHFTDLSWI